MDPMRSIHWQKIKYKLFKYKFLSIMYSLYANIVRSISFSTPHTKVLVQTLCLAHFFHSKSWRHRWRNTKEMDREKNLDTTKKLNSVRIRRKPSFLAIWWWNWKKDYWYKFWKKIAYAGGGGGGNNFRHNFCGASFGQVVSLLYLSGCTLGLS